MTSSEDITKVLMKKAEPARPGWKTSEFWVTVGIVALNHITRVTGALPGVWGMVASIAVDALSGLGYNVSRGIAKR